MKKILLIMSVAIIIALYSAPSNVKASVYEVGICCVEYLGEKYVTTLYCEDSNAPFTSLWFDNNGWIYTNTYFNLRFGYHNGTVVATKNSVISGYIPFLQTPLTWTYGGVDRIVTNNEDDYISHLPEEFQPHDPTLEEQIWDDFYELYKLLFGFYPLEGSLIDLLRKLAIGDEEANTEIIFPTFAPTPTPTPTPTPIPVQVIYVQDGNGNTTVVYQYPDPTTGVITQSPYNPNIENNITVNCDCDGSGGSGDNTFGTNPQDPYTLTSSMLWADGFGVQIVDNPLTAANESQQTLAEAASEYADSVNVASNSFNILPVKWLTLVGLLGGILIIAGLIRTFLGG